MKITGQTKNRLWNSLNKFYACAMFYFFQYVCFGKYSSCCNFSQQFKHYLFFLFLWTLFYGSQNNCQTIQLFCDVCGFVVASYIQLNSYKGIPAFLSFLWRNQVIKQLKKIELKRLRKTLGHVCCFESKRFNSRLNFTNP